MQTQLDGDTVSMGMMAKKSSAMGPMAGLDFQKSVTSMDRMNRAAYQDSFGSGHREGTWGTMNQQSGSGFCSEFDGRQRKQSGVGGGVHDGMALPDHFLGQYYTQVRDHLHISTLSFL